MRSGLGAAVVRLTISVVRLTVTLPGPVGFSAWELLGKPPKLLASPPLSVDPLLAPSATYKETLTGCTSSQLSAIRNGEIGETLAVLYSRRDKELANAEIRQRTQA